MTEVGRHHLSHMCAHKFSTTCGMTNTHTHSTQHTRTHTPGRVKNNAKKIYLYDLSQITLEKVWRSTNNNKSLHTDTHTDTETPNLINKCSQSAQIKRLI